MEQVQSKQVGATNHKSHEIVLQPNEIHPASITGQQPAANQQENKKHSREQKFQRYWNIIDQKQTKRHKEEWEKIKLNFKKILQKSLDDEVSNRALGAIFGATIGDALGAFCEFFHQLDDKVVQQAMRMEGGGTFGLEAGQFTDDSQLATHLLTGLLAFNPREKLTEREEKKIICNIAEQYIKWVKGGPFDIGNTTRNGISTLHSYQKYLKRVVEGENQTEFMEQMFEKIYQRNSNSMANGSLMRISPLAFFFALTGEDPLQHTQFIKDEIRLTHPNLTLATAGVCWVNILTQLITRKGNQQETFANIIQSNVEKSEFSELKKWFLEAEKSKEEAMGATPNMGFAKIGFTYGLRVLHYLSKGKEKNFNHQLYHEWMYWIIKRAGDTDTNGAIAGGLMGSVIGFWDLPETYVARSLKTITSSNKFDIEDSEPTIQQNNPSPYYGPKRPSFYQPSNVLLTALQLMSKCLYYNLKQGEK